MGKGDKKTKKGKIAKGSFGNLRKKKSLGSTVAKPVAKPAAKPAAKATSK